MKNLLEKIIKHPFTGHGIVIISCIVSLAAGWMTLLMCFYSGYLIFWYFRVIVALIRDIKARWLKILAFCVLSVGLSPGFAIGLIPLWFAGVVHLQKNPEIKQNVAEYKTLNATLRNASYFNSYVVTAREGEICEKDFLDMARRNNWNIVRLDKPVILDQTAGELIRRHQSEKNGKSVVPRAVDVSSGYRYIRRRSNGGGISVVWDSSRRKVYIVSNPR